jgi:hypothetical protein
VIRRWTWAKIKAQRTAKPAREREATFNPVLSSSVLPNLFAPRDPWRIWQVLLPCPFCAFTQFHF